MKSFSGFVFTFLVFLLSFYNSYSQNQGKIDSLKVILRQSDLPETTYIKILNDLTWQLRDIDHEAALKYQSEAATKSFQLSDSLNYARSIYNLAYLKYSKGQLKEAIGLYKKSIDLYDEVRRNDSKVEPMVGLGIIEFNQGNYLTSLNYYLNAYETLHKYSNRNRLAINEMSIAYNIGNIYYITGKYRKALEYYNDCLDRSFKEKNDEFTAAALTGLSNVYYDQKDFDRSIEASLNTISIYKKQGNQKNLAVAYNNIGEVYKIKQNLSKALEYYEKSLKIKKDGGNKFGIATTLLSIGEVYIHSKQVGLALEYINRSLQLARKNNFKLHLKMCYLNLVHVYKLIGDYESVYKNQILYSEIKDSIFNEANTRSMNEMQAKYESDKKEKEIEILTKDNELQGLQSQQQEGQIKKQWYLILGIGSILGLLISLIYVVYSQLKFKKQANKELEQTNDQLEHINKDLGKKNKSIAESINYAQRIQETIMPTQKHLQEVFPESFIFYKSKDVVSGDFPWVMRNEKYFFAAAVDCTGHGVPGAMMSMIGYFLLNDIVGGRKIQDPALILEQLHEGIKQTLKQEENLESQDGMDIALCAINKEKREVHYAGAHRSLLLLHNSEIEEIRGDRFPVGGIQYSSRGKEIKFKSHKLKLDKGDSIYFYSDGLIDQVGGAKGRRFQNNQVKEIITENKSIPMNELKDVFNDRFNKWMGREKQLDDVIMMGIKV